MKKPINKFAVALWVIAALLFVSMVTEFLMVYQSARDMAAHGDTTYIVMHGIWAGTIGGVGTPLQLAALGVLIELVDQIRWNALNKAR